MIVVIITLGVYANDSVLDTSNVITNLAVGVDGSGDDGSGSLPSFSDAADECRRPLQLLLLAHAAMLVVLLMLEISMARLALRGTMWDTQPRSLMEYILYSRLCMHCLDSVRLFHT